jgi:hypothetical protein
MKPIISLASRATSGKNKKMHKEETKNRRRRIE